MAKKTLDMALRNEITLKFFEGLEKKGDAEEVKEQLAQEIFAREGRKYSIQQIKAVASQVTIQLRNKILKPNGILSDQELHPNALPYVRLLAERSNPAEPEKMEALALSAGTSAKVILTLRSISRQHLLEALGVKSSTKIVLHDIPSDHPDPPHTSQIPAGEKKEVSDLSSVPAAVKLHSGAFADYKNSPMKEKQRLTEASFYDHWMDPDPKIRAQHTVLVNPGIEVEISLRHLFRCGIKPENVYAAEYDPDAYPLFEQNAHKAHIHPHFGTLGSLAKKLQRKIDVVLFDPTGYMHQENQDELYNVQRAAKLMVSVNFLKRREDRETQERLQFKQDVFNGAFFRRRMQKLLTDDTHVDEKPSDPPLALRDDPKQSEHLEEKSSLQQKRETGIYCCLNLTGVGREESWLYPNMLSSLPRLKQIEERFADPETIRDESIIMGITLIETEITRLRAEMFARGFDFPLHHAFHTMNIASLRQPCLAACEKYEYTSTINNGNSPYLLTLGILDTPVEYRQVHSSTSFMLHVLRAHLQAIVLPGSPRPRLDFVTASPRLPPHAVSLYQGVRKISTLQKEAAEKDNTLIDALLKRYPLKDFSRYEALERKKL